MRMRLHKNTRVGDYDIYPIYDIDFAGIVAETGYTSEYSNDAVGTAAYKYRQFRSINSNLINHIPATIPKTETADGNIIPYWHRYNNVVDGRYTMPQENLASYAAVEQGVRPPDWGTNPNYIELIRETVLSHDILRPYLNRTISTWSSSISYYEDTKRTELRMFYTDTGCSFAVTKTSYSRGDGYYIWPRTYSIGLYPHPTTSLRYPATYAYTDAQGRVIDDDYYINDTISVINPNTGYANWDNYTDGYNCQMVFVHFVDSGTDFYGFAVIQMSDFTDNCYPVAIHVSAWDTTFWGSSIIPGGGGGGGNWGPSSYAGGADGQWTFSSDNRGDTTGATVASIATDRRTALQAFYAQEHGYQLHQILPALIPDIFGLLYSSSFLDRYTQSIFNPLSAVISLHLLPQRLCDPQVATSALTLSGYDVSAHLPTPQNFPIIASIHHEYVGTYEFEATDTYLDYAPFTSAYLHLPYVGVLEIDINAIAGGSISVDYLTDAQTGNCAAYITCVDRDGHSEIKYCATGNCAYTLPMYALNQDGAAVGKIVGSTLGLGMAAITGNPAAAVSAATGLAGGIFDAATAKRNTQITGSFGGNPGMISDTVCWLEIIRPCIVQPNNFDPLHGTPSLLSGTIAAYNDYGDGYQGFLRVLDIDADGIQATADEIQQIETLLKSGIYVNTQ